jgi:toxin FitB
VNYLLDTNIISEVGKRDRCNPNVARWYASIDDSEIYLSALVLGEIRKGVETARPRNPLKATMLERWLTDVIQAFEGRIFAVDSAVADEWGRMSALRTAPVIDGLLAATARVHSLTLATRNTKDVAGLGCRTLDPFQP